MKKQVIKTMIVFAVWCLLLSLVLINCLNVKVMAVNSTITISTNKSKYNVGDDIVVTVKLNENAITASFYLNYNSSFVSFVSADTRNFNI